MARIRIDDICHAFRMHDGHTRTMLPVLDSISLAAQAGEFISILGPSGAGKSTLFNILAGLLRPDRGEVYLDGSLITGKLGQIAYMPQKDLLFPWRTVIGNAVIGPELAGVPEEHAREKAWELAPLFGLNGFEDAYPPILSGGMRQRAALMRTAMLDREVMALDEPFGALDAMTRYQMQVWLGGIRKRLNRTILFITHDMEEALMLSDRIVLLSGRPARVVETIELPAAMEREPDDPTFISLRRAIWKCLEDNGSG